MNTETQILDELRRWLKEGATIRATDPSQPVLEILPDGNCNAGITVDYKDSQREQELAKCGMEISESCEKRIEELKREIAGYRAREAQLRDIIVRLADQQAMPDDWWVEEMRFPPPLVVPLEDVHPLIAAIEDIEPYCKAKYGMPEGACDALAKAVPYLKAKHPTLFKDGS